MNILDELDAEKYIYRTYTHEAIILHPYIDWCYKHSEIMRKKYEENKLKENK